MPQPATAADLHRVFYVSRCIGEPEDVRTIEAVAQRRNAAAGLTGALLFTGGGFAQVLEGPPAPLAAVLAAIQADPRHAGLRRLIDAPLAARRFGDWAMVLIDDAGADELVQHLLRAPAVDAQRAESLVERMFRGLAQGGAGGAQPSSRGARNS